jgi:prolipoprotein diacylglyceryltransferase
MTERDRPGPRLSGRAFGTAVVVGGLLLFCWPFVRTPPLGLGGSYLHLLGSWLAVIVVIALTARALRRNGTGDDA